ncbi:MAG: ABC transporter substrate-binding protein [Desulfatiglandales bacterium]
MKYKITLSLSFLIALCISLGCQKEQQEQKNAHESLSIGHESRTIAFYGDKSITVPQVITKVASGWNAQNSIIAMLGYGDRIVATTNMIKASPIFRKFVPSIKDAVICFVASGELNIEGLLQAKPEVAFIPAGFGEQRFEQLDQMGIPVACLKANSLKNMVERTVITGRILGPDAYQRALQYVDYYDHNVKRVVEKTSQIPKEKRIRVYHSMGNPLVTSGDSSLVQDWMDLAGVINIAKNWNVIRPGMSGHGNANLEQIIDADPEVIICMGAADADTIRTDPGWSSIQAVKDGKVYVNPRGMFLWCRETSEEALQFLWLAKTVYPHLFPEIDMSKETRHFYKTFYGYELSDDDVQLFLNPE